MGTALGPGTHREPSGEVLKLPLLQTEVQSGGVEPGRSEGRVHEQPPRKMGPTALAFFFFFECKPLW